MAIDFIQGQRFKQIADATYSPEVKTDGDYDNLPNTFALSKVGNEGRPYIVYTHTMYVADLFEEIKKSDRRFVVITHNSDNYITNDSVVWMHNGNGIPSLVQPIVIPQNVVRWFSKNTKATDPRITSIPIGLENDMWSDTWKVNKKEKISQKLSEEKSYGKLAYMNFSVLTNKIEREVPKQLFEHEEWVTAYFGQNGGNYDNYIDDVYNHRFVFSPTGNGLDTHRTWEALYLNTIPIEKTNENNIHYADLPIFFVDEWTDITPTLLRYNFEVMSNTKWNLDKLKFSYWESKIKSVR